MSNITWEEIKAMEHPLDQCEGTCSHEALTTLTAQAADVMQLRFGGDIRRISHAYKVMYYTSAMLDGEFPDDSSTDHGSTRLTATLAAALHDIGIQQAERKHGSSAGPYQELEGPPIAREILESLSLPAEVVDRVCYLVGHHHTRDAIDGPDFQILWEADLIVNLLEENIADPTTLRTAIGRNMLSPTGKKLAEGLFIHKQ